MTIILENTEKSQAACERKRFWDKKAMYGGIDLYRQVRDGI